MKSSGESSFGRIISSKLPYHNYTQTIIIVFCLHKTLSLKGFWGFGVLGIRFGAWD